MGAEKSQSHISKTVKKGCDGGEKATIIFGRNWKLSVEVWWVFCRGLPKLISLFPDVFGNLIQNQCGIVFGWGCFPFHHLQSPLKWWTWGTKGRLVLCSQDRGVIQLFHLGEVKAKREKIALRKTSGDNTRESKKVSEEVSELCSSTTKKSS